MIDGEQSGRPPPSGDAPADAPGSDRRVRQQASRGRAPDVRARLVLLFLIGAVLFNFPLLSLFNHDRLLGGIPLLVGAVFGIWTALVATTAVLARRSPRAGSDG